MSLRYRYHEAEYFRCLEATRQGQDVWPILTVSHRPSAYLSNQKVLSEQSGDMYGLANKS